jgi:uncharacterized protein (TIGR03382 family)
MVGEPGSTVHVRLGDDTQARSAEMDAEGAWSFTLPAALELGEHSVSATATDPAGNPSDRADHRFVIQKSHYGWGCTTAPSLPATWALLLLALSLGRRRGLAVTARRSKRPALPRAHAR